MSAEPAPARPEDLLAHTGWVRALAGALVRDPSAADDLAQDALLAALEKPPATDRPLRPWFAGVVRNLWRERRRGDARRARREEARGPAAEPLPGPDDLAARVESHRLLAELVAALEEPFRSTVILRYFEDLSSAEIARRAGIPEGTVRWRLKRGLDELRERLDSRHRGDRRAWIAVLVPLAGRDGAIAGTVTGGVLAMGAATKAAVVLAVAAAGVGAFLMSRGDAVDGLPGVARTPGPPVAPPPQRPVAPAPAADTAVAAPAPPPAAEAKRPGFLAGRTVLPGGAPLAGAAVSSLYGGPATTSGSDGRFRLEIPCVPEGTFVRVGALAPGRAMAVAAVLAKPGEEIALGDLVLGAGGAVAGRVVDAAGAPVPGAVVGAESEDMDGVPLADSRHRAARDLAGDPWVHAGADGEFRLEGVPAGTRRIWAGADGFLSTPASGVEVREGEETAGLRFVLEPLAPEDTVEGFVAGPDGRPVGEALVQWMCDEGNRRMSSSLSADAEGRFVLRLPFRGTTTFSARRRDDAGGAVSLAGVAPGARGVALRLGERRSARLLVRDRGGRPVTLFACTVKNTDQETVQGTEAPAEHPGGEHRILLPGYRFSLTVRAAGFLPATLGPFEPGGAPEVLDALLDRAGVLRGRVTAGGAPVAGARVEVGKAMPPGIRLEVNGLLVRFESADAAPATTAADGTFAVDVVEAGAYHLLVEAPGFATGEAGPLEVDPVRGLDGVEIPLGRGGAVEGRVRAPSGRSPEGTVVCCTRADGKPRCVRVGAEGKFRFEGLAAGGWQVMEVAAEPDPVAVHISQGSGTSVLVANCRVEEGATTHFDLDLAAREETVLRGTFRLGEVSMEGWTAGLADEGNLLGSGARRAALAADGTFEARGHGPGRCRVVMVGPPEILLVLDAVDLAPGANEWSLSLPAGEGKGTAPKGVPVVLVIACGGERFAVVPVQPAADGSFTVRGVPAGTARIVVLSEENVGREPDPRRWPSAGEVVVR